MKRAVVSSILTFILGAAGGVVGTRLIPPEQPLTLEASPAVAKEIQVSLPIAGDGIADLVDQVKHAVVNIDTVSHRRAPLSQTDIFRYYFGDEAPQPREEEQKGVGSGFILESDGLIVTNHHVVRGADKLMVTLPSGKKYEGKIVGADPATDLALVKIEAKNLPTLKLATPESLRVGQYVVAVGSPLGLSQTVTAGILSAIDRDIDLNARVGFLQTDAPINPGNSGGPLLNLRGEVVGVNTAIAARGQGIGFAIPVSTLNQIIPQLEANGKVERAWLGVGISDLPEDKSQMFYPTEHGVLVGRVEKNGPADKAGLQRGDVVLTLNGKKLHSASELIKEVAKLKVGEAAELRVSRSGQEKTFKVPLGKMPSQPEGEK
ncbi:MAG: S1C family serine protease [Candidatus Sericytochromatia bacterium]